MDRSPATRPICTGKIIGGVKPPGSSTIKILPRLSPYPKLVSKSSCPPRMEQGAPHAACPRCRGLLRDAEGFLLPNVCLAVLKGCGHQYHLRCVATPMLQNLPDLISCSVARCPTKDVRSFHQVHVKSLRSGRTQLEDIKVRLGLKPGAGDKAPKLASFILPPELRAAFLAEQAGRADQMHFSVLDASAQAFYVGNITKGEPPDRESLKALDRFGFGMHKLVVVPEAADPLLRTLKVDGSKDLYDAAFDSKSLTTRFMRVLGLGTPDVPRPTVKTDSAKVEKKAISAFIASEMLWSGTRQIVPFPLRRLVGRLLQFTSLTKLRTFLRGAMLSTGEGVVFGELTKGNNLEDELPKVGPRDLLIVLADNILWRKAQDFWQHTHHMWFVITETMLREAGLLKETLWARRTLSGLRDDPDFSMAPSDLAYDALGKRLADQWDVAFALALAVNEGAELEEDDCAFSVQPPKPHTLNEFPPPSRSHRSPCTDFKYKKNLEVPL